MGIYTTIAEIGIDCDDTDNYGTLTYQGSRVYPTEESHKPAHVYLCAIPNYCEPGWQEDEPEDVWGGKWLRLSLAAWDETWGRPMIQGGATVVIDRHAARDLARRLQAWADHPNDRSEP